MQTQTPNMDPQFRYYAFISYSHKDITWAKWLQEQLESYRLPARLVKDYGNLPKKVYPVFRDETDLSGFTVKEALRRELEDSRYLVVVCSPRSCRSDYVNEEISYFASLGRERSIIPLIVDGIPFSGDEETECFPDALRQLDTEPLGISVAQLGKRKAFLRVISTLLNIRFDELVRRDARRQRNRRIVAAAAAVTLLAAIAGGIWYNTPHSSYYENYTLRSEVPEGICELTREERGQTCDSYRITTLRGKVVRLERVNSKGAAINAVLEMAISGYPVQEFEYDDRGRLISVENRDISGLLVSREVLTYNPQTSQIAIDYRQPSNNIQAQALRADVSYSSAVSVQTQKSQITRELNTYDETGLLIRTEYQKDNLGNPACDSNGVYGKLYEYDDRGLMTRMSNLDQNGEVRACRSGWAVVEYAYDEKGNVLSEQYYDTQGGKVRDADGISTCRLGYDENGNIVSWQCYDEAGNLCCDKDGIASQTCGYDENGFLVSIRNYDAEGNPTYNDKGIHETRNTYDEKGRVRETAYYDTQGQLTWSGENSCAKFLAVTDDKGRLTEQWLYDPQGEPVCERESGAYGVRYEYDDNGFLCAVTLLDTQGNPMMTKRGYASSRGQLSPSGLLLRVEYLDEKGNPVLSKENTASEEYTYDNLGNQTSVSFYDEAGNPCYHADGYARMDYAYEDGELVSCRYFDHNAEPMLVDGWCHELRWEYDEYGRTIRESAHDTQGNLTADVDNCAVTCWEYDRFGNVLQIRYFNKYEDPATTMDYHTVSYEYDQRGNAVSTRYQTNIYENLTFFSKTSEYDAYDNCIREVYYDRDGNIVSDVNVYIAEQRNTYDARGNLLRKEQLGADGFAYAKDMPEVTNTVEYAYDACGNATLERWIHVDGRGTETCLQQYRYTYNGSGNITLYEYLDGEGNYRNNSAGYAICKTPYDAAGNLISQEYYDETGAPALYEGVVFRFEYTYNAEGEVLQTRYYGKDNRLLPETSGYPAKVSYDYNARGKLIREAYYNERGELYNGGEDSYAVRERFYDALGQYQYSVEYNYLGEVIGQTESMVILLEVYDGSPAREAGLQADDILIQLEEWNRFAPMEDMFTALTDTLKSSEQTEKQFLVCRREADGSFTFLEYTLPAGTMGIRFTDRSMMSSYCEEIREAYGTWLATQGG